MTTGRQESGLQPRRWPKIGPWWGYLARAARVRRSVEAIGVWRERRRMRRHLTLLSEHMLQDIGVSRADVVQEAEKPFWRK